MVGTSYKSLILLWAVLGVFNTAAGCKGKIKGLDFSLRMAESEMIFFPELWAADYNPSPKWNYTQGLIGQAMLQLYDITGNHDFQQYARSYADKMIDENGRIAGYKTEEFNIDRINSGKFLFDLYEQTRDERYRKAIFTLRDQLKNHPRTSEGGFWHKKIYPHQMWLDGLYMGTPFYARFALEYGEPQLFDDVVTQFKVIHAHSYDPESGLNYHGWDESREQKWADPVTGCSPNFWGRAIGWYAMALVDVLDYIPAVHPGREELIRILNEVTAGIVKHQEKKSGLWYQVMDQGGREGNYLEATASSMFVYALLKASRKGYIARQYQKAGIKGYRSLVREFVKENGEGTIRLTRCCSVAGLGGTPYRDGSYEYYIHEPVRDNDPKGVGPFIMAGVEMNLAFKR